MLILPSELQLRIFQYLPLQDLLVCRAVNQSFKLQAEIIFSSLKKIVVNPTADKYLPPPTAACLFDGQYRIAAVKLSEIDSFFRFVSQYFPKLIALDATHLVVSLESVLPFAHRLNYFSFQQFESTSFTPSLLIKHFPNLLAYDLRFSKSRQFCPNQAFDLYPVNQLIQYADDCSMHSDCYLAPLTLDSNIRALVLLKERDDTLYSRLLSQVSPGLQLLYIRNVNDIKSSDLIFPHLQHLAIYTRVNKLSELLQALSISTNLIRCEMVGKIDKQASHQVRMLSLTCRDSLKYLSINSGDGEADHEVEIENVEANQEDIMLTFPLGPKLTYLELHSHVPIILENTASSTLKTLILMGPLPNEFTLNLPNLVHFYLRVSIERQNISWLIRCLRNSPDLELFQVIQSYDPMTQSVPKVDSNCVEELVQLMTVTRNIRSVRFLMEKVFISPNSPIYSSLDLSTLPELNYFFWELVNYPITIRLPNNITQLSVNADGLGVKRKMNKGEATYNIIHGLANVATDELNSFHGELQINAWGPSQYNLIHELTESCPHLSKLSLHLHHSNDLISILSIIERFLQQTCLSNIHLAFLGRRKAEDFFLQTFFDKLNKFSDRCFTIDIDQMFTNQCMEEELKKIVTSLAQTGVIGHFLYLMPKGELILDENKCLIYKEKSQANW